MLVFHRLLHQTILRILSFLAFLPVVWSAELITAQEAAAPAPPPQALTRGISRGPSIQIASPVTGKPITSPFDLKISFEARGGAKIDTASVKVTYVKANPIDLTPRLKGAISAAGIDFSKAEVPVGSHELRITVKDSEGRETNSVVVLTVDKQ